MKKFFPFILIIILTSCSKETPYDKLVERDGIVYEVNSTVPYTGTSISYFFDVNVINPQEDKRVDQRKVYRDGKLNGLTEGFYRSGQLKIRGNYIDNLKEGIWESFYDNGKKNEYLEYSNNNLIIKKFLKNEEIVIDITNGNGTISNEYSTGQDYLIQNMGLEKILNYQKNYLNSMYFLGGYPELEYLQIELKDWNLHGNLTSYYSNGEIHGKWSFNNGSFTGLQEIFEKDKVILKFTTKNGNLDGSFERYYSSGEILFRRNYVNGQKEGEQKEFYINGQEERVSIYKEGKLNSTVTEFWKSGIVRSIYNYRDDLEDGWYKIYETDGLLKEQGKYINGVRDGERQVFGGEFLDLELLECWSGGQLLDKYKPSVGYITKDVGIEGLIKKGEFCE